MKVGIIGSGGREHALCVSLEKSEIIEKIYCVPGNAGTNQIAENVNIDISDFKKLTSFVKEKKIEIVLVGPEKPLVDGIVDHLENENVKVFGPNKFASQLEGSKIFTKKICKKYEIPTAKFEIYNDKEKAHSFFKKCNFPVVVKADGLAAGKGVYICEKEDEAKQAVNEIFGGKFGVSKEVLIEEFLDGEEMSFFIISDGVSFKEFGTAQDHKRVFEGDKGKNTGGMGAYSPSRLESIDLNKKIINKIINPTLKALREKNEKFKGFLYAGLMIVNNEPFLIEYNVRMGDPECQTILPKLETDLFIILEACTNRNLDKIKIEWKNAKSLCIVVCSNGYPDKFEKNFEINGLEDINLKKDEFIFHAGTKRVKSKIVSNGGRVLNFVILSNEFKKSRTIALELIKKLNWSKGFFRKDIGFKVIRS